MTAPEQGKEKVAAAWFVGILALAFGGAGLLIAAIAVGTERVFTGGKAESARNAANRGSWFDNQQAWLDADRGHRAARHKARNDWLTSGADPEKKPAGLSVWARMGNALRRTTAHIALAGRDFKTGFTDTTRAGKEDWKRGGSFTDMVKTRPQVTAQTNEWACPGCGTTMSGSRDHAYTVADLFCDDCQPARREDDEQWLTPDPDESESCPPDPEQIAQADAVKAAEERDLQTRTAEGQQEHIPFGSFVDPAFPDHPPATDPESDTATPAPASADPTTIQGDTMPETATVPQQGPVQGDTNLDQTTADLADIRSRIGRIAELNDQLSAERGGLIGAVATARERAESAQATTVTLQALDAAEAVCSRIDQNLAGVADATVEAADQTDAADRGLDPARHAQDALHQSGASGRFVSAAAN